MIMNKTIYNWKEVLDEKNTSYNSSKWEDNLQYMSFLLKYTKPGDWLDVGCGLGFFVECCDRYGLTCYGIEGDESGVEIGKNRYSGLNIQTHNITTQFPFVDKSFSAIFCNQVIEHIPYETTSFVLSEIFRVLKDDGVAFINMPNKMDKNAICDSHINLMTPSDLIKYLNDTGFKIIIPTLYPKFVFGNNIFGKMLSGLLFVFWPINFFSSNSSAIAIKNNSNHLEIKGRRYFYFNKLMSW